MAWKSSCLSLLVAVRGAVADDSKSPSAVPSFFAADTLDEIRARLDPNLEGADLLGQLTTLLVADVGDYLDRRKAPETAGATLRMVLAAVGVLSALGLVGLGLARLDHQAEKRRRRSYRFPDASGRQRLGAPFGAMVSSRRFAEPPRSGKS
jgi:hypothetical protein